MRNIFAIFLIFLGLNCSANDQLVDSVLDAVGNQMKKGDFDFAELTGSVLDASVNQGNTQNNSSKIKGRNRGYLKGSSIRQFPQRKDSGVDLSHDGNFNVGELVGSVANQSNTKNNFLQTKWVVNPKDRQPIKFLERRDVFPKEEVKAIEISPDGQRIICLVKEGKTQYLKNIPSKISSATQIIKEKYPINNFVLFGKNILYTYYDENDVLKVKVQYSLTKPRLLNLPSNLKSVRFFKNNSLCMAECYDGEEYTLYSIRYNTKTKKFLCKGEKRLSGPIQSLFNSELNPVLTIKNENGLTNVYANQDLAVNRSMKRKDRAVDFSGDDFVEKEEDELPDSEDLEDSEDSDNLVLVGQIHNPDSEKYFSVDKDNNWYTATLNKTGNTLLIDKKKMSPGAELKVKNQKIYELRNVSSLSRVKINLDQDGVPSFVSISDKQYKHFSWSNNIKRHLNVIDNRFNYASWYRINTSSDGKIWLICVMSDKLETQFFTYNTTNRNFTFVPTNPNNNRAYTVKDYRINKLNLRSMSSHYLSKGYVHIFFVRGVKSTVNSPLIVMTNSSEQYDWKYMPTVQILANRGFNVLCLNYRKSEEDFTKALRDVINSNNEQKNESREDEDDDDRGENDNEKDNREELSSDELEKSERIVNKSVNNAIADIKESINWAVKNGLAKYGNIILFAENHSIIPAMRLFLKNQASFAGFVAIDPSEDDMSLVSAFDYDNNLKPTMILGEFKNSESINAFLEKVPDDDESNLSVINFSGLLDLKLATGVVETFLAKIFTDKKIESLSQRDIKSLSFIKEDGLNFAESSDALDVSNWQ